MQAHRVPRRSRQIRPFRLGPKSCAENVTRVRRIRVRPPVHLVDRSTGPSRGPSDVATHFSACHPGDRTQNALWGQSIAMKAASTSISDQTSEEAASAPSALALPRIDLAAGLRGQHNSRRVVTARSPWQMSSRRFVRNSGSTSGRSLRRGLHGGESPLSSAEGGLQT
jgi:hypothetical protein